MAIAAKPRHLMQPPHDRTPMVTRYSRHMGAENDADDEACLATVQLGKPAPGSTADTVQIPNPGSASAMIRTLAGESIAPFATAENNDRYVAGELLGAGGMGE